jgi:hypothetical protein
VQSRELLRPLHLISPSKKRGCRKGFVMQMSRYENIPHACSTCPIAPNCPKLPQTRRSITQQRPRPKRHISLASGRWRRFRIIDPELSTSLDVVVDTYPPRHQSPTNPPNKRGATTFQLQTVALLQTAVHRSLPPPKRKPRSGRGSVAGFVT